jgi:hypothetical protein
MSQDIISQGHNFFLRTLSRGQTQYSEPKKLLKFDFEHHGEFDVHHNIFYTSRCNMSSVKYIKGKMFLNYVYASVIATWLSERLRGGTPQEIKRS